MGKRSLSELSKSPKIYGRNAAAAAKERGILRPFTAGTGNNDYKAEKTTRQQFRHHVVPFMAKFLGYYKISAQNLNLKEFLSTKA